MCAIISMNSSIDWNKYRDLFSITKDKSYFMTAGAGAIAEPVLEAICNQYAHSSKEGGYAYEKNIEIMESCRAAIAKLINAEPCEIAFVPSVSYAMNALAHSFKDNLPVIMPDIEFPSTTLPWVNLNYDIQFVSSDNDFTNDLIQSLKQPSILISSLVQYSNGYLLDLSKIAKLENTLTIINATQCIGALPINVVRDKIDILVAGCHKWMFCGEGLTFLYINKRIFKRLKPSLISWRSSPHLWELSVKENRYYDDARVFECGWPNSTIFAGLQAALNIITQIGVSAISERISELMLYLIEQLILYNIPIINTHHVFNIIQIGPFVELDTIVSQLKLANIYVNKRGNGIRIALHFYNNKSDIDKLIQSLLKIIDKTRGDDHAA